MIAPLQLSFEVACTRDHAFAVWTGQVSSWWPPDHMSSGDIAASVVIEPRIGGRIFERSAAGREIDWGEVTAWDPPVRLAYIWHIGAPRTEATDVEITFVELSNSTTRVHVVHSGWERLGAAAPSRRDVNRAGWDHVIPAYRAFCAADAA